MLQPISEAKTAYSREQVVFLPFSTKLETNPESSNWWSTCGIINSLTTSFTKMIRTYWRLQNILEQLLACWPCWLPRYLVATSAEHQLSCFQIDKIFIFHNMMNKLGKSLKRDGGGVSIMIIQSWERQSTHFKKRMTARFIFLSNGKYLTLMLQTESWSLLIWEVF